VGDQHDCPEREKLLYKRNENSKLLFFNLIERNVMEKIDMNEMMERVGIHLNIKMRDAFSLALLWEMSISDLEEMLFEDWNDMSDKLWIEINDIISFKKEWV
jgi:hypothetical protein